MELDLGAELTGLVLFLILAAMATAAQASLAHVNRARLRLLSEKGNSRAQSIMRVVEDPAPSVSAVATLTTLALAGAALFVALADLELASLGWPVPLLLTSGALLATILLQAVARAVAIARPEATALALYRPVMLVVALLTPLLAPVRALERRLLVLMGGDRQRDIQSAEEQLRMLVESSEQNGVIEHDEREMIHGIFELGEVTAREIMVPRIDVVALPHDCTVQVAVDKIIETGHSRLPIFQESIDNVVGLVYAKDILRHLRNGSLADLVLPLARPAHFVPEAKKVDELLSELQQRRIHMAVVVDEYGGTAGLVTIEDLLEEIVGEIRDEYDQAEEPLFERLNEREAIFDARMSIRDVNDILSLDLPDEESDSLGGLVYDRLGKVPVIADEVQVDGCLLQVLSTEGHRIKKVRLLVGEREVA